jgi:hypothetical protein
MNQQLNSHEKQHNAPNTSKTGEIVKILLDKEVRTGARAFKKAVKAEQQARRQVQREAQLQEGYQVAIGSHKQMAEAIKAKPEDGKMGLFEYRAWDEPGAMKNIAMLGVLSAYGDRPSMLRDTLTEDPSAIRKSHEGDKFWSFEESLPSSIPFQKKPVGELYSPEVEADGFTTRLLITTGTAGTTSTAFLMFAETGSDVDFSERAIGLAHMQRSNDRRRDMITSLGEG